MRSTLLLTAALALIAPVARAADDEAMTPAEWGIDTTGITDPVLLGETIFQGICANCHGEDAISDAGGDIRDADDRRIRMATRGIENMPAFRLTDDERAAIAAYLADLQARD